jgi:hypothetical protein
MGQRRRVFGEMVIGLDGLMKVKIHYKWVKHFLKVEVFTHLMACLL